MTVMVGRLPGADDGAVALGVRLGHALGARVVVCTVVSPGEESGSTPELGDGVTSEIVVDRSVPGGLARAAQMHQARMLVLGDAPRHPGSVGTRLARAAGLPVALAGESPGDGPITRVTCAYGGTRHADTVLDAAADLADRAGATLRVASFAPQRPPTVPPEAGLSAERGVVEQWRTQILADQRAALAGRSAETLAVAGATIEDAVTGVDWGPGDILVVGASAVSAATRVLLGDPGGAILRAAPVPVVLAPVTPT